MRQTLLALFEKKAVRFLFFGTFNAGVNIALITLIIHQFQIETAFFRNVANVVSIEISLLIAFVVYRIWVWRIKTWNLRTIFLKQLPKYHAASAAVILARTVIIFPILDWIGVDYLVNTSLGIGIGAVANYFVNDRLVFKG